MSALDRLDRIHRKLRVIIWMVAATMLLTGINLVLVFLVDSHL